jgi:glyoxylase-like metal-dependent hydrolase (beta-lactamase superfamily II)
MKVLTFTLGPLTTNCYLVWQDGVTPALLIDCAGDAIDILNAIDDRELELRSIVITHGHADHIEGLGDLQRETGAEVAVHEQDAPMLSDAYLSGAAMLGYPQPRVEPSRLLDEGDVVHLLGTSIDLTVLHTPGHSPGGICLLGERVLFSGDTLFAGGIGRIDLPGGDPRAMSASLKRLMELDSDLIVHPGHGPATTIGEEREGNPWLDEF